MNNLAGKINILVPKIYFLIVCECVYYCIRLIRLFLLLNRENALQITFFFFFPNNICVVQLIVKLDCTIKIRIKNYFPLHAMEGTKKFFLVSWQMKNAATIYPAEGGRSQLLALMYLL